MLDKSKLVMVVMIQGMECYDHKSSVELQTKEIELKMQTWQKKPYRYKI